MEVVQCIHADGHAMHVPQIADLCLSFTSRSALMRTLPLLSTLANFRMTRRTPLL